MTEPETMKDIFNVKSRSSVRHTNSSQIVSQQSPACRSEMSSRRPILPDHDDLKPEPEILSSNPEPEIVK